MDEVKEVSVINSKLRASGSSEQVHLLLTRLEALLTQDLAIRACDSSSAAWEEFLSLLANGKILSTVVERHSSEWFSQGSQYTRWLGYSTALLLSAKKLIPATQLCHRALLIGYPREFVETLYEKHPYNLDALLKSLSSLDQRRFFFALLANLGNSLQKGTLSPYKIENALLSLVAIPAVANLLVAWLTKDPSYCPVDLYKACIFSLGQQDLNMIQLILDRCWLRFGDKLSITHMPIIQQEALTQIMLISAGYVNRREPARVLTLARSNVHTTATSLRLASLSSRVRLLGMIVATTVSQLVDKPDLRLTFDTEEMKATDMEWYHALALQQTYESNDRDQAVELKTRVEPTTPFEAMECRPTVFLKGDSDPEPENLVPYHKYDDPFDDDIDPTLVQRDKPLAPRYVRDLVEGLRDSQNYEKHKLALSSAHTLIRQKASFGTELRDQSDDLASVLIGLQDIFKIESFSELQRQALISMVVAEPIRMGRCFAWNYFAGDYSVSQRGCILSTLGMAARELLGIECDNPMSSTKETLEAQFPSDMLSARIGQLWSLESLQFGYTAQQLESSAATSIRVKTIDQASRQEVTKDLLCSSPTARRSKNFKVVQSQATLVTDNIFFPLIGYWTAHLPLQFSSSILLPFFVKTLAIIMNACGPSTLPISRMTTEFWNFVLSLRTHARYEQATLEALLFAFLTILTVNEDKRQLAQNYARELVETHEWVSAVFDEMDGRDEESKRSRSLAASVLISTKDVVEAHHRLLLGNMIDM